VSDTALLQQAKTLRQIGEVQFDKVRYEPAMRSFTAALARTTALAKRQPQNADVLFERAQAEFYIGQVHFKKSEGEKRMWFTRYRDSSLTLLKLEPASLRSQREVVSGHHNLAVVDWGDGKLDEARAGFIAELAMAEKLAATNPGDLPLQFKLADINSWLGRIAEQSGNFQEAAALYVHQIAMLEALVKRDPDSAKWRVKLADACGSYSALLSITGQLPASLLQRKRARTLLDALVQHDPANRLWQTNSILFALKEAMVRIANEEVHTAAQSVSEARTGLEKLAQLEPSDRKISTALVAAWRVEAEVCRVLRPALAMDAAERAVSISRRLVEMDRTDEILFGEHAAACIVAGLIAGENGNPDMARAYWGEAIKLLDPLLKKGTRHWRLLDPAARAFALLGQNAECRAILEQLREFGYEPLDPWPQQVKAIFSPENKTGPENNKDTP
jgi:serine/threonine-protein kinase